MRVGVFNRLKVKELARREGYGPVFGVYLEGGREGDILMPQKYVPEGVEPGDEVDCFVYLDQEERLVATTEKPLAPIAPCSSGLCRGSRDGSCAAIPMPSCSSSS